MICLFQGQKNNRAINILILKLLLTPFAGLKKASERRDFTIGAIMKDTRTGEIIDSHNGIQDLKDGIIRHTSDKFTEDGLRIYRAAQFASRFNFKIADETKKLFSPNLIKDLSNERVKEAIKSKILNNLTIDEQKMVYKLNKYREIAYLITDSLTILNIENSFYETEVLVSFNGYRYTIYTKDDKISEIQASLDQFYRTNNTFVKLKLFVIKYKDTKLSQLESELQNIYGRIQNLDFEISKIKRFT